jgi:hypothetical protein
VGITRPIPALVGAMALLATVPARAQQAPAPGEAQAAPSVSGERIVLNVFAPPVTPGAPVFLNATLTNPTDAGVYELRQTLTFRREHLRFVGARLGIAAAVAAATLDVQLADASGAALEAGSADAAARATLTISAASALPPGPLVEVEFRQVDAREQSIRVHQIAEARGQAGTPLPGLAFADVDVSVSTTRAPEPLKIFSCFFYMH